MAKINYSDREFLTDEPEPSQGMIDGKYRLGCAVLAKAIRDLHDEKNIPAALDALCWLSSGEADLWAESLGYFVPEFELLPMAARGRV